MRMRGGARSMGGRGMRRSALRRRGREAIEARERALIEMPESAGVREKMRIEAPRPGGALITAQGEEAVTGTQPNAVGGEEGEAGVGKEVAVVPREKGEDEEEEVVDVMAPKKDTRSAGVDGWAFRARNSLMFSPGADVSPYDPSSAKSTPAKGPPRIIKHGNTRLAEQDERLSSSRSEPPSPTQSRVDNAIAGTPCTSTTLVSRACTQLTRFPQTDQNHPESMTFPMFLRFHPLHHPNSDQQQSTS